MELIPFIFVENVILKYMITNIQRVVKNLKSISFMQPIYEAINNALEAAASNVKVHFHTTTTMFEERDVKKFVVGVTIEDNGVGFTTENVYSFCEYLTDKKADLGCKGIGRFTWLKVFQRVHIASQIKNLQGHTSISFVFDFNFTNVLASELEKSRIESAEDIQENKTVVKLEGVTNTYFDVTKQVFHSPEANLKTLSEDIRVHLLPNLILRKKTGRNFTITFSIDNEDEVVVVDEKSIPELQGKEFMVEFSAADDKIEKVAFNLLMSIEKDGKGISRNYFCAHNRTVSKFESEGIKITIPEGDSSLMLLTSPYLDDRVNQERNGFEGIKPKSSDLASPLSWENIKVPLVANISTEIDRLYPDLQKNNIDKIDRLIDENPYLAKYLRQEQRNVGILNTEEILKRSKKHYEDDKEKIEKTFLRALERNKVDSHSFREAISDVQEMSTLELARYIVYRQNIIKALKKVAEDSNQSEEKLHSLFMQMLTLSKGEHYLDSNLWLFDDKYMTYDYAASDCSIKRIFQELKETYPARYAGREPDLSIFYSTPEQQQRKDLVVVEFKKPQATRQEKDISITEIANNVAIFKKHITSLGQVWNYIVTTIDDAFVDSLVNQDFQPLFSPGNKRIFYKYYKNLQAHCYAVSIESIVYDSNLRNKTFLDILTGKRKETVSK